MGKKKPAADDLDTDDLDDFDDDSEYSALDFNLDYDDAGQREREAEDEKPPESRSRKKNKKRSGKQKPQIWDDDWQDPADDLMYGFDNN